MPSPPQLPPQLHTTKNLPSHLLPTLLKAFQETSSSFSDIMDSLKPDLVIFDIFQPWAPNIASSKGVPSVYFSTSGATPASFFHHVYTVGSGATFPFPAISVPADELARMGERERKIEEEVPAEFLETVKERGLVVTRWAPQTKILGHASIGGFVSHFGRSSITESMYFGVPVIAMPMNGEQPLNAQLMVELGVGVEVEKDHENGVFVGDEIAKTINKAMVGKNAFSEGLRSRARRMSETMREKEEEEVNEVAQ